MILIILVISPYSNPQQWWFISSCKSNSLVSTYDQYINNSFYEYCHQSAIFGYFGNISTTLMQPENAALSEQLPGQQTFKIFHLLLEQVLTEYKYILSPYLNIGHKTDDNTAIIKFQPTFRQNLPNFISNITRIINPTSYISRQDFQCILNEISLAIKRELIANQNAFDTIEQHQYTEIAIQSEKIWRQNKKFRHFKNFQWTKEKMMQLDSLSIFLRISESYKRLYKMSSLVYCSRYLCKIFECTKPQLDVYTLKISQFLYLVAPLNNCVIEELAIILYLVQLRKKIANFYQRHSKSKVEALLQIKESIPLQIVEDPEMGQFAYFTFHEQYRYKFCEIAFIPNGKQSSTRLQQMKISHQTQLKVAIRRTIREGRSQSFFWLKQQLLILKAKFSVSFVGLFCCYQEVLRKQQKDWKCSSWDLELCPWIFIKDKGLDAVGKEIFDIEFSYQHVFKDSPLFISLCEMAINRFSLYSSIVHAHSKIDSYLGRQMVYICKFHIKVSEFINLEKEQAEDIAITLIIAVINDDIRYVVLTPGKIEDIEFARIIKSHFQTIRRSKTSIIIYCFDYKDDFYLTAIKSLFIIRKQADVRVYFTNSPYCFHLHFMAYFLIKALIFFKMKQVGQFGEVLKWAATKILKAINASEEARYILRCSHVDQEQFDYQSSKPQFDEKYTRETVTKAYQCLAWTIFQRNDNHSFWDGLNPTKQRCFQGFNKGEFSDKIKKQSDIFQATKLLEMMKKRSIYFVNDFVEQMKRRHPHLTPKQFAAIRSNFLHFRLERQMQLKDFRRILMYVCRCLLCYQAYFKQIAHRNELDEAGRDRFRPTISFLQQIYMEQSRYIDQIYPQQRHKIAQELFGIDLQTGETRCYKDQCIWNRRLRADEIVAKNKTQSKGKQFPQNCIDLSKKQQYQ